MKALVFLSCKSIEIRQEEAPAKAEEAEVENDGGAIIEEADDLDIELDSQDDSEWDGNSEDEAEERLYC